MAIKMIVDTALAEVPVNAMALIDDTDFKTREESVVYNQAGMDLLWNFVTTGGAFTQTAVTPTTAGVHDWTSQGNGMYTLEIPASAGTINNDTEGYGWFTGFATGILPWAGPIIEFVPANIANSLVNGTDTLQTDVIELGGDAQSGTDLKDFADAGYDPAANKVQGVVLVDTTTTNTDMRGTDSAALASVATEARLAELDAANLPTDIAAIPTTAMRGTDNALLAASAPTNFGDLAITVTTGEVSVDTLTADVISAAALSAAAAQKIRDEILPTQNAVFNNIPFLFVAASDHVTPVTGATTMAVTRQIDGGSFSAGTGTGPTEIANGIYVYDASAADMNGGVITFRFTATGGTPGAPDDRFVTIVTTGGV